MKRISYGNHWISRDDIREVVRVLRSDWITQGPKIEEFERGLSAYTGAKYAVVVSSGTAALHIACLAIGIKSKNEVVTSPLTFVASANCVLYCGGKPVFADVDKRTANIDPAKIEEKITKKTRAIIPVHFAGHPCKMEKIRAIAKKHGLYVIEDAAHALGSMYNNSKIGSCRYSDMTILSFHPVKAITTGEGGAVLTNDKAIYKRLLMFRNHGITRSDFIFRSPGDWHYEMQSLGFNYRMTDLQSALGSSQLRKLDKFVSRRREIAARYDAAFRDNGYFDIPVEENGAISAYHLYPIRIKGKLAEEKRSIFSKLRELGIGVQVHYIPVYMQPYYRMHGYSKCLCPTAEDAYKRMISIPIFPRMSARDVGRVIDTVQAVFEKTAGGSI